MITRDDLTRLRADYERQEAQALADANAAHGAIMAIDALVKMLDQQEAVNDGGSNSDPD